MNAGQATIEWLYSDQLQIDDEWAVRTPDGFRWWAYQSAQTVEVVGVDCSDPDEETGYFMAVRTELLRELELTDAKLVKLNELCLQSASMSGPVYDPDAGTLTLCSLVRTHGEIAGWMERWLSMAAALQLGEAYALGPMLAAELGADGAVSGHPDNGLRPVPDDLLNVIPQLVAPQGAQPARWQPEEFEAAFGEAADELAKFPGGIEGNAFVVVLAADYPGAVCHLRADVSHPLYGHGLMLLQQFPGTPLSDADGVRLALSLNDYELTQQPLGYGFGSYSWRWGSLHFSAFFPNAMHDQVSLVNLFYSCCARAQGVARALGVGGTR